MSWPSAGVRVKKAGDLSGAGFGGLAGPLGVLPDACALSCCLSCRRSSYSLCTLKGRPDALSLCSESASEAVKERGPGSRELWSGV